MVQSLRMWIWIKVMNQMSHNNNWIAVKRKYRAIRLKKS